MLWYESHEIGLIWVGIYDTRKIGQLEFPVKETKMKKFIIYTTAALFSVASFATTFDATYNGTTYTLTRSDTPISYDANTTYFTTAYMPWWGDSAMAYSLASQVQNSLGYMVDGRTQNAALFAYGTAVNANNSSMNMVSIAYWMDGGTTRDCPDACPRTDGLYYYVLLGSPINQANLVPNAYGLRSIYNSEHAVISQGLENDCDQFNDKGICIAAGGRYGRTNSTANVENNEATSSTLIAGYKYRPNVRLGGWIDAGLGNNAVNGVTLNSGKPLFGFYGVWSQHTDGTGYQVKASMAYGEKDIDVQRTSNNFGGAGLNEQAFSLIVSREFPAKYGVNVTPYGGVKYTRLNRSAYTEQGSGGLTYDALADEQTSAVLGVKASKKVNEKTTAFAGLGIEQKLNRNVGTYSAGSSSTAVFTDNPHATQATLTAGMVYQIDKKSRIDANVMMKQDPYMNTNSTAAMVTYKVGL